MKKQTAMNKKVLVSLISSLIISSNSFSCTIFTFTNNGKTYFCNNEDYSNNDTEVRFYPAKNGKYAWVYFGFSNNWAQGGVNEKGLCWDWVAGFKEDSWKEDTTKMTIGGNPSEKMITQCATVEEAIKFYQKYNEVSFSYARTMIADRFGNSVIIGWKDGQIYIQRNSNNLQCFGYRGQAVESYFSNNPGDRNIAYLAEALNVAHQEGQYPTQYSNIISLSDGKIFLYKNHNYNEYLEINYLKKLTNGYSKYKIADLFDVNKKIPGILLVKGDSLYYNSLDNNADTIYCNGLTNNAVLNQGGKCTTDTLNFVFEGKKLSGFIDMPVGRDPSALIIIVPGHEVTNFGQSFWAYDTLFSSFTNIGISCFRYDKAGCGDSDGSYNNNQTVQNSAKEIVAAINELKRRKIKGSDKIGLWGISRAGYICPLVIKEYSSIAFWISVSGADGLDSSPYRIESDLIFAGLPPAKAKIFVAEYQAQNALIENGGTYEEYVNLKSKQEFRKNDFFMNYMNIDREFPKNLYDEYQKNLKVTCKRDNKTNICIIVPDFNNILTLINCPVLAIFGEKDYVADWRKTLALYKEPIGKNNNKRLTIKTFPNGNHGLRKCKTGASNEVINNEEFCDGYIETMTSWLKENGFGR